VETVLITGAGRGIGLELARRFADSGRRVIATFRGDAPPVALEEIAAGTALEARPLEVTDPDSVEALRAGLDGVKLDVLVNNAGVLEDAQGLDDMDYAAWLRAFEINTLAPFRLATALLPCLRRAERPRIVTLSSQMASLARKSTGSYAYRSSKAAVNKVMQVLAVELEGEGIIVCPVHPGWVRTDMGGSEADISVDESADGLFALIGSLRMEQSGRFWTWDGREHPW
jgi:NAD(P)-dependent dehydrogenase (short-subunit alcohol dehydrogenase family)